MERLIVFEPGEAGERSSLNIAFHPQGPGHIHRLVGETALVSRRLQGYGEGRGQMFRITPRTGNVYNVYEKVSQDW